MTKYVLENKDFADGIYNILKAVDWRLGEGYDVSTGIDYKNDVFETSSFWAHAEDPCFCGVDGFEDHPVSSECGYPVGFRHFESGLEVNWYKRVGRSTESNKSVKALDWYAIVVQCLESVRDDARADNE